MGLLAGKRRWLVAAVLIGAIAFYKVALLQVPFFSLACRAGSGRSCAALAEIYADERAGARSDAIPVLTRGCERLRHAKCCADLVTLTATGVGTTADFARAEKMCLEGDAAFGMACLRLGHLTVTGRFGAAERKQRAEAFYRRACTLGVEEGCERARTVTDALEKMSRYERMASECMGGNRKDCDAFMEKVNQALDR